MKRKDLDQVFDDVSSPSSKSRRLDAELLGVNINGDLTCAFQVFQQQPQLERSLKRKELDEAFNDMSSPLLKSRRLDAELFSGFEQMASQQKMVDKALLGLPLENDEKALVLYNPSNSQPFYKTPASKEFSIIVNSDLIPGLRDRIFARGSSNGATPSVAEENNTEESKGCMAIVPWVESTWPPASYSETQAASLSEPEEVEMMDTYKTGNNGFRSSEFGVMMNGSDRLQQWYNQQQQLHCYQPHPPGNNTCTNPVSW